MPVEDGSGISPRPILRAEIHVISGLIPDPSIAFSAQHRPMDLGSVLVVGKVINKITFQPEYDPPI